MHTVMYIAAHSSLRCVYRRLLDFLVERLAVACAVADEWYLPASYHYFYLPPLVPHRVPPRLSASPRGAQQVIGPGGPDEYLMLRELCRLESR